jgi:putative phosphoribosyl transferase
MRAEADDVICLAVPDSFIAIALHYRDFPTTQDEDVARILDSRRPMAAAPAR